MEKHGIYYRELIDTDSRVHMLWQKFQTPAGLIFYYKGEPFDLYHHCRALISQCELTDFTVVNIYEVTTESIQSDTLHTLCKMTRYLNFSYIPPEREAIRNVLSSHLHILATWGFVNKYISIHNIIIMLVNISQMDFIECW